MRGEECQRGVATDLGSEGPNTYMCRNKASKIFITSSGVMKSSSSWSFSTFPDLFWENMAMDPAINSAADPTSNAADLEDIMARRVTISDDVIKVNKNKNIIIFKE